MGRLLATDRTVPNCESQPCGLCGLSILSNRWTITAGHCCHLNGDPDTKREKGSVSIVIGTLYDTTCSFSRACTSSPPTGADAGAVYVANKIVIKDDYAYNRHGFHKNDYCMVQSRDKMVLDGVNTQLIRIPFGRTRKFTSEN